MKYTVKDLDSIANNGLMFLFEFWNKDVVIGNLVKRDGEFLIVNIRQRGNTIVRPTHLNRIISTFTFRIINSKKFKEVDIFEFNELVQKANCEII